MQRSSGIAGPFQSVTRMICRFGLHRMRQILAGAVSCCALTIWLGPAPANARPGAGDSTAHPFSITELDPALHSLIAPDAKLRTVATGFVFADGPVWIRGSGGAEGYLLAVSIFGNVIYKVTPEGKVTVFLDRAGYSGTDFAHVGKLSLISRIHMILMGPNCTGVDRQGRVIWCAGQDRALMRLEKDGARTVLASGYEGKRFNGPNDVAIADDGTIYMTDSDVGLRGGINGGLAQMPDSVWRWKDGKVTLAVSRSELGGEPNGIALSPDDKYLYLSAGTGSADPKMMRYPVNADGSLGPGELFTHGHGIGDGMKADSRGDIWSSDGPLGIVRVTSPAGKPLGLLNLPTRGDTEPQEALCASALAFGGNDAKTLYVTACDVIYAIPLRVPGILEGPAR